MATIKRTEEMLGQYTGNAVETVALWADTNQKILRELVDLSATTAKEGVGLYADLQASAVEALKGGHDFALRLQSGLGEFQKDPVTWYQKTLVEGLDAAQAAFKLLDGNAQAITQSGERLQTSAEQVGKQIQQAFVSLGTRLKALYTQAPN